MLPCPGSPVAGRRAWACRGSLGGPEAQPQTPTTPPCSYYKGIRQMVQVSDQDMNTHLAEISRVSSHRPSRAEPYPPAAPG